jgi:hypothetical protein
MLAGVHDAGPGAEFGDYSGQFDDLRPRPEDHSYVAGPSGGQGVHGSPLIK